jgi:hypothetical protein
MSQMREYERDRARDFPPDHPPELTREFLRRCRFVSVGAPRDTSNRGGRRQPSGQRCAGRLVWRQGKPPIEHPFYTCQVSNLTQAWTTASAALPNGWRIVGILHADLYAELAKLPAYLELASTYPDQWVAVAEGPSGDPGEVGQGDTPQQALLHLARILEPIRGIASG